jgi:hypothetical protein
MKTSPFVLCQPISIEFLLNLSAGIVLYKQQSATDIYTYVISYERTFQRP